MTEVRMSAISDILDSFDVTETSKLLEEQILNREMYGELTTDQFQPLYINYNRLVKSDDATDEEVLDGKSKFQQICMIILGLLKEQFGVELDDEWVDENMKDLPAVTMALYNFFVLDIFNNVYELCRNYIAEHSKELYQAFKDIPRKPMGKQKGMTENPVEAVILSNIYDICTFILSNISVEEYPLYLDKGYIPMTIIDQLYKKNAMVGDYATFIANVFQSNIGFRSQVGFDLIYRIKNKSLQIQDSPHEETPDEEESSKE